MKMFYLIFLSFQFNSKLIKSTTNLNQRTKLLLQKLNEIIINYKLIQNIKYKHLRINKLTQKITLDSYLLLNLSTSIQSFIEEKNLFNIDLQHFWRLLSKKVIKSFSHHIETSLSLSINLRKKLNPLLILNKTKKSRELSNNINNLLKDYFLQVEQLFKLQKMVYFKFKLIQDNILYIQFNLYSKLVNQLLNLILPLNGTNYPHSISAIEAPHNIIWECNGLVRLFPKCKHSIFNMNQFIKNTILFGKELIIL